jgi:hypothetical protein
MNPQLTVTRITTVENSYDAAPSRRAAKLTGPSQDAEVRTARYLALQVGCAFLHLVRGQVFFVGHD